MVARNQRAGLTIIDLLVIVAIVAVLSALAISAISRLRESANATQCRSNLRQLTLACHVFDQQYTRMPGAFGFFPDISIDSSASLGTLIFQLLPMLEQEELYQQSWYEPSPDVHYYSYQENGVEREWLRLLSCPSDYTMPAGGVDHTKTAACSYAANYLVFGITDDNSVSVSPAGTPSLSTTFTAGLSHTILFAEKYANASIQAKDNPSGIAFQGGTHWDYFQADCATAFFAYLYEYPGQYGTDPNSVGLDSRFQVRPPEDRCNPCLLSTPHASMNAALADGSVQTLAGDIAPQAWWALCAPNGGTGGPW
jgi:hypothetical protein